MKKKIPTWMKEQHAQMKQEWERIGSPGDFYSWLVDRVDDVIKKRCVLKKQKATF